MDALTDEGWMKYLPFEMAKCECLKRKRTKEIHLRVEELPLISLTAAGICFIVYFSFCQPNSVKRSKARRGHIARCPRAALQGGDLGWGGEGGTLAISLSPSPIPISCPSSCWYQRRARAFTARLLQPVPPPLLMLRRSFGEFLESDCAPTALA